MEASTFVLIYREPVDMGHAGIDPGGWSAVVCQANGSLVSIGPYSTQAACLEAVRTGINPPARQIPGDERFYSNDGSEVIVSDTRAAGGNPSQAEKPPTDMSRQLSEEEEFLMGSNDD